MSTIGKEHHENHKLFSQKIHVGIQEAGDEALSSIKNVDQAYWDEVITTLLNNLIFDLEVVVHNFQQIEFKAKAAKSDKADLQGVINIFSRIMHALQLELGKDLDIPKSLLETYIPQIIDVAATLLAVIEDDKLHEYKYEEVELFTQILVALSKVSATLQMEKPEEIKNCIKRKLEQLNRHLDDINFDNPNILENLKMHIKRSTVNSPSMVQYLNKQSNNFDGKLKSDILNAVENIHLVIGKLIIHMEESKNVREVLAHTKYAYNHAKEIIMEFIEYLVDESKIQSAPNNIISLARYLGIHCVGILTMDIEYFRSETKPIKC